MARPEGTRVAGGRHRRIPLADEASWRRSLAGVPHAFAHTWAHCAAMERASARPTFLLELDTPEGACLCPLQERARGGARDLVTPYGLGGFVGAVRAPSLPDGWSAFARAAGYVCAYVALHPLFGAAEAFAATDRGLANPVYLLDLTRTEAELLRTMSDGRRRELAVPLSRAETTWPREELAEFFVDRYPAFMRSRGAAPVYDLPREALAALVDAPGALLVGAGRGAPEAVALFGTTPWVGTYLFGISDGEGARYSARLVWRGALELARRGVPCLDLGGGVRPSDGIAEFKRRFGAVERPVSALRQVFDVEAYRRLCQAADADPDDRSGFFPPYHRTA